MTLSRIRLGIDSPVLDVVVDDPFEATRVAALYREYVVTDVSGESAVEVRLEVDARGGTVRIGPRSVRAESRPDLLAAAEIEITRLLLASRRHFSQVHASGAVVLGRGVLALGPSGAGKSSLAMEWHRAGHALLGDDVVLVGADGSAHGFPRLLKLDTGRARLMGIDVERSLAFDPAGSEVWYDPNGAEDVRAGWARGPVPVATVAIVRWRSRGGLRLNPITPAEALNGLLHELVSTGLPASDAVGPLALMAEAAVALEVVFDDAREAAEALAELTGRGA